MKELEYPFDNSYILKKKKSIKRELLSSDAQRLKKRIAVLGGSTTSDIISTLELFLLNEGIEPEFYECEYAQFWQDVMFENEELVSFKPDIVYIHTSTRNIKENINVKMSSDEINDALDRQFDYFKEMWEKVKSLFDPIIIQNNFELPYYRLLGNKDASDIHGKTNFISRLNQKFYDYVQTQNGFYINDINYLSASYGIDKWSSPQFWYMYKYCCCLDAIPELSFSISNIIKSALGKNKKAFALDLDNTLWGGVVGDDGVDGIEIGQETAVAEGYQEFQEYIKAHKDIGIMLSVASKNDEENAIAGLNHPDGVIRPDDLISIKANWDNKDINIEKIADEINIGVDSIVFVDDNPAERAIVSSQLGINAPEIGTIESYIKVLDRSEFFEVTNFSDDDIKRNEMYIANAKRQKQQSRFKSYDDYLLSLEMVGTIKDFESVYIQRITQLTNKSNQFNVTTKRYTQTEIEEISNSDNYIRLYGKLVDKFGDNGIVSVVIGKKNNDVLDIDLWLMSCRVLKRNMEYAMLDRLVEECVKSGIKIIKGYYYKSPKNKMVSELFGDFGFNKISQNGEDSVWEMSVEGYKNKNKVIMMGE